MAEPDRPDPPVEPPEPPESVPPVSAEPPPEDPDEPRRYPSTIGGAFYLLVLGVVAVAMVVVALDEWRSGVRLMGGALIFAAAVRLVLRRRDAGMLAVRHKVLDAAILIVLGGSLIFLAGSIPDQPGGF
ncbi:DUF3017 domain-containing protein [Nocardioides cavernae]|uniref:DUF3017 domain-containing protein n=1 Tax=Nocardioides cavernae TaxID=1921566 RepID=A0ABR8NAE9_9ACTN|nr:DUF3017 domain-containing protein [Nocardioides cavernae]MBD3925098.1 DUF3017 domain-containing protein [Nocardioides cavernae]MBM7514526.1 hypothetical protein [Nocardioides cavernae]